MTAAANRFKRTNQGYSLVELLLTTSLLLLFAGLGVLSLRGPGQGPNLSEGAIRFEGVLRYARAEAANSGRRVRVNFVPLTTTNQPVLAASNSLNEVQLTWEPNPYDEPEVFETLRTTEWGVDQVNETIGVQAIRRTGAAVAAPASWDEEEGEIVAEDDASSETPTLPSSITFNPDGSCDSAEITLAARGGEDDRRVTMRIEGLTGTISRLPEAEEADSVPDHLEADQQAGSARAK